jgi:hypothetical protein
MSNVRQVPGTVLSEAAVPGTFFLPMLREGRLRLAGGAG